ncbi:response regulator transcription factor [Paenibacillus sedimenti]|uniref:Response regulator n=1 Tax=Paenibacillus sedimenti TaxID=2770274 RepID=A0A926KKW7_9BACL|nr:response regulator [Paenibacillus sedimenti]MBD0379682.1 response regulator [Paenibacillus sedimenti]
MYKILLMDDERWVRTSVKKVIERTQLPFTVVHEAPNGLEALDWLKGNTVDLAITDVNMPVMDGLQFIRALSQLNLPIETIIFSGHDDFQYAQQAMRLGARDYLVKPVLVEDMAACLQRLANYLENKKKQSQLTRTAVLTTDFTTEPKELSAVEQVMAYVKDKLPGEVTLQEAAAKVHLNPSYLSHLFKQQTKINFIDYVMKQRMEEAKKLLSTTALSISNIADRLGYNDLSYFSNTFKKYVGQSPSEYRKELS